MAGGAVVERAAIGAHDGHAERGRPGAGDAARAAVQHLQRGDDVAVETDALLEQGPQLAHHHGGLDAVTDHVADDHDRGAVGQGQHVEPVSARRGAVLGQQVARCEGQSGHDRQPVGQQRVLQGDQGGRGSPGAVLCFLGPRRGARGGTPVRLLGAVLALGDDAADASLVVTPRAEHATVEGVRRRPGHPPLLGDERRAAGDDLARPRHDPLTRRTGQRLEGRSATQVPERRSRTRVHRGHHQVRPLGDRQQPGRVLERRECCFGRTVVCHVVDLSGVVHGWTFCSPTAAAGAGRRCDPCLGGAALLPGPRGRVAASMIPLGRRLVVRRLRDGDNRCLGTAVPEGLDSITGPRRRGAPGPLDRLTESNRVPGSLRGLRTVRARVAWRVRAQAVSPLKKPAGPQRTTDGLRHVT